MELRAKVDRSLDTSGRHGIYDSDGAALHGAVLSNSGCLARILVECFFAKLDIPDMNGETPLHYLSARRMET